MKATSLILDFKCQTIETSDGYPVVCVSAEIVLSKLVGCEIRCIDTGSLREQIEKAVVSTVAMAEKMKTGGSSETARCVLMSKEGER